ncbi:MAG TPA: beta/gamma crystallin-related protein [Caulobacteraceae bacterium]|nr:beta/gamma crystallin-related protein [Caulobacteraceae bacterium]
MRPLVLILAAGAALFAASALAQPVPGRAEAVLFDRPDFEGASVTIVRRSPDLAAQDFAGRARSGHFDGDWVACDAPDYGGRCERLSGDVADLASTQLGGRLASVRQGELAPAQEAQSDAGSDEYYDRSQADAGPPPPPPPPASLDVGIPGHSVIFFARPREGGAAVEGQGRAPADRFCRTQGLGPALYYDLDGGALRDVLCRRY